MDFQVEICTKKNFFFFYKSETVKNFHFFFETKNFHFFFETDTRFIDLFYEKKEVSEETAFIFYFYCGSVSRENWMKLAVLLSGFLASKKKLADGFIILRGIKLWNRQRSVGKQNETDGTRRREKNETDGTRLRRGRQFHFLPDAAAVSFILFPTDSGGFIILAP